MTKKQKNLLTRVLVSGALLLIFALLPLRQYPLLRFLLYLVPYLIVGYDILRKAYKGVEIRRVEGAQRKCCQKTSVFFSRETGMPGNFVGRTKGAISSNSKNL